MRIQSIAVSVLIALSLAQTPTVKAQGYNFPDRRALIANTCPHVELTSFVFENRGVGTGSRFVQSLKWKNVGTQPITAFEVVMLKYDPFDRRMIGTRFIVTGTSSVDWKPLAPGAESEDGTIGYDELPPATL